MGDHRKPLLSLPLFCFLFSVALLAGAQLAQGVTRGEGRSKLFVFGDSYADTGNNQKAITKSWKHPYGVTFPGKPTGRFSDGRVFTDYLASFLDIKSPIPYKWRKIGGKPLRFGMNFAYGGTGVFDTLAPEPNMTTQIQFFRHLLIEGVFTQADLQTSIALVSVSGNDYSAFLARNGTDQGLPVFIASVLKQMEINLKTIGGLGVKKIVVPALQPIGCLPDRTRPESYQRCNGPVNMAVNLHNQLLQQLVQKLNNETVGSPFVVIDFYTAFMSVLEKRLPESAKFETPLTPCCVGVSSSDSCGSLGEKGEKKYTVCNDPKKAFFWDSVHPTQQGWHAVYSALRSSLHQLTW